LKSKLTESENKINAIKVHDNRQELLLKEDLKRCDLELIKVRKNEKLLHNEIMNIQQSNRFIGQEKKLIFDKNVEMIEHLNKLKDKLKDYKYWKETGIHCLYLYICVFRCFYMYLYVFSQWNHKQ
jgi:hypothetical protein